ncbi:Zn-ribbon domain-containing OB-fold protein [Neobacillus niacini]|uniref:Zn-ribbon domain-containing OB-fold protein n=1 Tax=Neobacillus niacini TaxID=86668 RepID=UPI002FFE1473
MNKTENKNLMVIPGEWNIRYEYAAGEITSTFLQSLRDKKVILASKCTKCSTVMLPPRAYCEKCFVKTEELVEAGNEGVIEAATIITHKFENFPEPPYAIAYVRLDGVKTAMVNFVHGVDLSDVKKASEELKIGTRVKVEFKEEREGRVTDFYYRVK